MNFELYYSTRLPGYFFQILLNLKNGIKHQHQNDRFDSKRGNSPPSPSSTKSSTSTSSSSLLQVLQFDSASIAQVMTILPSYHHHHHHRIELVGIENRKIRSHLFSKIYDSFFCLANKLSLVEHLKIKRYSEWLNQRINQVYINHKLISD